MKTETLNKMAKSNDYYLIFKWGGGLLGAVSSRKIQKILADGTKNILFTQLSFLKCSFIEYVNSQKLTF